MLRLITDNNFVLSCNELSSLDKKTYENNYIPPIVLMEEAASEILKSLNNDFADLENEKIAVISGWGNNGGDALSVCRKLFFKKIYADVYIFSDKDGSELYKAEKKILESLKIKLYDIDNLEKNIGKYSIIIDAVFGIGYKYREDKKIENIFNIINSSNASIVSVDVPSGLNVMNQPCVKADFTYSIGFVKDLFFNTACRKNTGIIRDLKISFDINNIETNKKIIYLNNIKPARKKLENFVHKYSRGSLMAIGGQPGKFGSIIYSAESSLKAGAGITVIITENENVIPMNTMAKEIIIDSFENIDEYINKYNTILIGPGLNLSNGKNKKIIEKTIKLDKQFILDASFFSLFDKNILNSFKKPPVLTPHSQEFKSFFKEESENLNQDTINTVTSISKKYKVYILLKESFLIFSDPQGNGFIYDNPARILAQAGSGDILAGIISGIVSQGFSIEESVLESLRIFYSIADKYSQAGYVSYSPDKFINMISRSFLKDK